MAQTVRVRGIKELNRDLGRMGKKVEQRQLQKELRTIGEPVAEDARGKASEHRFSGPTVSGLRIGTRRGSVVIRQRRGRTTGTRPDFGALQMNLALIPALDENTDEIVNGLERYLDRVTAGGGRF